MKYSGIELTRHLSLAFGPSGYEDEVRDAIIEQIEGECDGYCIDRVGNLVAKICGRGMDYRAHDPKRLMICAHMDEVGFMVSHITDEGYLKFGMLGGMDPRVLCGKHVTVMHEGKRIPGLIATKAIHLQTPEERKTITPVEKMYIDIGAKDAEDATTYASVGDYATFDSDLECFGEDSAYVKGKALDDRVGCAAMIEIMRSLYHHPCDMPFDVYFAFTCCEEIGIAGAIVAANTVCPDVSLILESTAVNDLPDTKGGARVSELGDGGVITIADKYTIYDAGLVRFALAAAEEKGIKCQIKQYMSGGNDSRHVQQSTDGVRVMALSLPTRYIHSSANVGKYEDYESIRALIETMLRDWRAN
jgi:endoglucanase